MFYLNLFLERVILSEVEGSRGNQLPVRNRIPRLHTVPLGMTLIALPAKSIQSRYVASDDQGVNIVCAFVR